MASWASALMSLDTLPNGDLILHGRETGLRAYCATRFLARARGLLGTSQLAPDTSLWVTHCNSVHTFGMTYPIDVVFLDRSCLVMGCREALKPWRWAWMKGAHSVLELAANRARVLGFTPGLQVTLGA